MMTFKGYPRADGTVGVRNYVVVTSTVACSNGAVLRVAEENPGVISMCTVNGCGNAHDSGNFRAALNNICRHPNVYAVIILGLGCEDTNAQVLGEQLEAEGRRVFVRQIQHDGGSDVVCREASAAAKVFLQEAAALQPVDCPIEQLTVALRYTNEDAATVAKTDPALGLLADRLIEAGATVLVSQTGAYLGGEDQLITRAANEAVKAKLTEIYTNTTYQMERYYGNKAFCEVTPEERAMGLCDAAKRAAARLQVLGKNNIDHVIDATGTILGKKGLIFQDGTMIDTAGITEQLSAGAALSVVSTGRLSLLGWPAAPVLKIATEDAVYQLSPDDLDLNAGEYADPAALAEAIWQELLCVASGKQTAAEALEHDGGVFETHFRVRPEKREIITEVLPFC